MENVNLDEYLNIYYNGIDYFNNSIFVLQSLYVGTIQMNALGLISNKKRESIHIFINNSVYNITTTVDNIVDLYSDFFDEIEIEGFAKFDDYGIDFKKLISDLETLEGLLLDTHEQLIEIMTEIIAITITCSLDNRDKAIVFNNGITNIYNEYLEKFGELR